MKGKAMYTAARNDDLKEDATQKARAAADDIRKGARRLKEDAETDIGEAASAVREDLESIARQAGRYVHDLANSTEESMVTKVREKPVTAMLIAAGAGFVIGALLSRR
jgi:ElaB/YqjD/DUF883 family membrane-anchored ribosome-binding protein